MQKRILRHTLAIIAVISMTSCATIFSGSKKRILIDANIEKADQVIIDGRKHNDVTFPFQTKVKRGFYETLVTAKTEGYKPATITIYKDFNAVAVLNLFDILGWGIDAATGAMMKPEYDNYELEFTPSEE